VQELSSLLADLPLAIEIVAVNDGSAESFDVSSLCLSTGVICSIEVLHLGLNLGHQRAIAIGLVDLARRRDLDGVFVMDCDGEDRPADLLGLYAASHEYPGRIIVARREKRSEGQSFKIGYALYKFLFRLLTGEQIYFGNFSFMPMSSVRRLVFMSEIWNNLPAAILRSRISFIPVATTRGSRYFGRSRMNWAALVNHGLSAMSVYIDIAFLRILFGALTVVAMILLGIAAAVIIRLFTTLAIPGWTTTVVGVLGVLLAQVMLMVISMLLLVLAGRSGRPIVPIADVSIFVAARQRHELGLSPPRTERSGCNEPLLSGHRT
jgi:hypothetical protein